MSDEAVKSEERKTLLVWTAGYNPWVMGGDVHAPVGTELEVGEKIDLGKGYFGYLVVSPISGNTHVAEAETGAFVGDSINDVRKDIEEADEKMMAEQIAAARERLKKVRRFSKEEFWGKFSDARKTT